jgi:hypothetical protein
MKKLQLISLAFLLLTGCYSDTLERDSSTIATEVHRTQRDSSFYETSLGKKVKALRDKPNRIEALRIVRSTTSYDTNFVPTVHLEVENTTETAIIAFEVRSDEINFTKRFKVNLKPHSTYATTFKIIDPQNLSGDIFLSVSKFIYNDGEMVEAAGNSFEYVD